MVLWRTVRSRQREAADAFEKDSSFREMNGARCGVSGVSLVAAAYDRRQFQRRRRDMFVVTCEKIKPGSVRSGSRRGGYPPRPD